MPIKNRVPAAVRDLQESLQELEQRCSTPLGPWQRTSVITQWRAAAAMAGRLREHAELAERVEALRKKLSETQDPELLQRRERLEQGRYSRDDLRADLSAMPEYLWDPWVRQLFDVELAPLRAKALGPEMVDNVPTNVRTIWDVAERLGEQAVVYDIGAGAGTVVLLLALMSGRPVRGVEVDKNYADFAAERCKRWGLKNAEIAHADACTVDYGEGTDFYLYDPFRGQMLERFVQTLRPVAQDHVIQVFAFGACHKGLEAVPWLQCMETTPTSVRVFRSK